MSNMDIKQVFNEAEEYDPEGYVEPPRPLMRELETGMEFPVKALGELADAAMAIQESTQAPMGLCAQSVLAAASLAIQAHANVELPTGQVKPTSEFFLSIGASGERKTSCDELALKPILEFEKWLGKDYEKKLLEWQSAHDVWHKERETILKGGGKGPKVTASEKTERLIELGAPPLPPLTPLLVCPEPTFEGLVKLLQVGQPSVGIFSDEGGQFIGGHGMNKDNKLGMATNLSACWDGKSIRRVRAGDGTILLPGRRICFHLMLQPKVSTLLLGDEQFADQGLLSRVLVIAPTSTVGTRFWRAKKPETEAMLSRYYAKLGSILRAPLPLVLGKQNELEPKKLLFSSEAKAKWVDFVNKVEFAMGPMGAYEPIKGLANKLPEHAARIATVIALYEEFNTSELSAAQIEAGIELAEFYAGEALRLFNAGAFDKDLQVAQVVLNWLQKAWKEPYVSLPDIYQYGPNEIREQKYAKKIATILKEHGWLNSVEGGTIVNGKRRNEVWEIKKPSV
jgi:hypothetical protein